VKERRVVNKTNLPEVLHANKLLGLYRTSGSLSTENSQKKFFYRNSELGLKIRFWAKRLFGYLFPAFCMAI